MCFLLDWHLRNVMLTPLAVVDSETLLCRLIIQTSDEYFSILLHFRLFRVSHFDDMDYRMISIRWKKTARQKGSFAMDG